LLHLAKGRSLERGFQRPTGAIGGLLTGLKGMPNCADADPPHPNSRRCKPSPLTRVQALNIPSRARPVSEGAALQDPRLYDPTTCRCGCRGARCHREHPPTRARRLATVDAGSGSISRRVSPGPGQRVLVFASGTGTSQSQKRVIGRGTLNAFPISRCRTNTRLTPASM